MKTFRFTVPEPPLTEREKQHRKPRFEGLGLRDYVAAFIAFFLISTLFSLILTAAAAAALSDEQRFSSAAIWLSLATVIISQFLAFHLSVKFLVVDRLQSACPEAEATASALGD